MQEVWCKTNLNRPYMVSYHISIVLCQTSGTASLNYCSAFPALSTWTKRFLRDAKKGPFAADNAWIMMLSVARHNLPATVWKINRHFTRGWSIDCVTWNDAVYIVLRYVETRQGGKDLSKKQTSRNKTKQNKTTKGKRNAMLLIKDRGFHHAISS